MNRCKIVQKFPISIASFVQDCFLPNCPKSTLFGVFDGHGGKQVSMRLVTLLPNVWDFFMGVGD